MKLATFSQNGHRRIGVVVDEAIVDLAAAAPQLPQEMRAFLAAGAEALASARAATVSGSHRLPLAALHLDAPVPHPTKFLAVGLNYADHIAETGRKAPGFPMIFNKQASCVTGPHDPIHLPRASNCLDYEGELGFVIGRRCRHVPAEHAAEVIAGYCVVNDVSVRDWQNRSPTTTLGKSWDTHGPLGPWIVTADGIGDPHSLDLKTWVNGELRQDSNTKHLVHNCFTLVALLSTVCTLEPGDVISTGTPSGVAIGFDPPKYLSEGDVVRIEIARIGAIENRVIAEPADSAHW